MSARTQPTRDPMPCRLCFGKYGQHPWRSCPARCHTCDGMGQRLSQNRPAGQTDSQPQLHGDTLRESICPTCNGSGLLPEREEEVRQYHKQLEEQIAAKAAQQKE
jgi:DnaJ-class molecular chaperone